MRSHLLRTGDLDGLYAFARYETSLRASVRTRRVLRERDVAEVTLEGRLRGLTYRRDGDRVLWHPPEELRARLDGLDLDFTKSVARAHVTPLLRAAADKTEVVLEPETHAVELRGAGEGLVTPVITATLRVPPHAPGEWQLVVPVRVSGLTDTAMTIRQGDRTAPLTFVVSEDGRFRRPPWIRRQLSGRLPRPLVRAIRARK